jgi:hypothetical protein
LISPAIPSGAEGATLAQPPISQKAAAHPAAAKKRRTIGIPKSKRSERNTRGLQRLLQMKKSRRPEGQRLLIALITQLAPGQSGN